MRTLLDLIGKGTRNQSVGLLTIGGSMLILSAVAEAGITGPIERELAQCVVIAVGLGATAVLFRKQRGHRP